MVSLLVVILGSHNTVASSQVGYSICGFFFASCIGVRVSTPCSAADGELQCTCKEMPALGVLPSLRVGTTREKQRVGCGLFLQLQSSFNFFFFE